jgi:hypothetical protein
LPRLLNLGLPFGTGTASTMKVTVMLMLPP